VEAAIPFGRYRTLLDTIYSLSGDVPPLDAALFAAEDSSLQPGALIVGSIRQLCLIRKISAGGAVLHADLPIEEGERLELELDTGEQLDGVIAWRRGLEVGLRFDVPIDVLPILARNLASQPGERRRMPRVEIVAPTLIETASGTELITLRDIAQGGVRVETPFPLKLDERVTVTPEGLRPLAGTVRWVEGRVAGISFHPELAWQELIPWLRARRDAPASPLFPAQGEEGAAPRPMAAAAETGVHLNLPARVREGTRRWSIDVSTLTTRSVEFECYAALLHGTLLWIVLPGLEGWPARIVDIDGYRFTCEFTQPLHPAVLERVLALADSGA
jgi:hypothetical protein